MALPGHSPPPPFNGPGSPTRMLNGHLDAQLPPMYGPPTRSMLPPSPQNYRFPNPPPVPGPSPSFSTMNENRSAGPYKRPSSSMSISSMLGGEPEQIVQDLYSNHNSRGPLRQGLTAGPPQSSFLAMSPPHQTAKPGLGEYTYKPRSRTPDKMISSNSTVGARQRSSSSGTTLQRSAPFAELHNRSASAIPAPRYFEQPPNFGYNGLGLTKNEQDERVRRTSLTGILQRPNSQPQASHVANHQLDAIGHEPAPARLPEHQPRQDTQSSTPLQRNGVGTTYDIKPPASQAVGRAAGPQISPSRVPSLSASPEIPRQSANASQGRSLASILNGPPGHSNESASMIMARQDSAQSQSDRSLLGDKRKLRQYSPFATSIAPQATGATSLSIDDQGRKGSDELSQHRILLGLATESKRGRYSPMPQVVQGVQAQTPIPDSGVKREHGRVFSGIGGGMGTTPTPVGGSTKKDDRRTPLAEDGSTKMSRSASGFSKKSRKFHDDDLGGDPDVPNGNRVVNGRASKKNKYQHSYKVDLEEGLNQNIQRRHTPLTGTRAARNVPSASASALGNGNHLSHSQQHRGSGVTSALKPRKTIQVASIFNVASKTPRRHLGNFIYRPDVAPLDLKQSNSQKFDVSIRPNLISSFSADEHVNCTYAVYVPRMWLQDKERGLICAEQYLWGSGIYCDDSDPVTAAVHAGFLKASFGDTVDTTLLSRVVQEQNPQIEWPKNFKLPSQPMDVVPEKDLKITMLVLPLLEKYEGSARFGIRSRTWPEMPERTPHDGVSFAVLNIEFVDIGVEEMRIGRTGISRRNRLRMDLEARQRGLRIRDERIARAKQKRLEQLKPKKSFGKFATPTSAPTSIPATMINRTDTRALRPVVSAVA